MPFGMGFTELVLILTVVVVVFGATKLPDHREGLGDSIERFRRHLQDGGPRGLLQRTSPRRWKLSDWLLVGVAIVLAAVVIANVVLRASGNR